MKVKRIIMCCLIVLISFSLSGCVDKEVKEVEDAINSLGEITLDSQENLQNVYNQFKSLSQEKRNKVSNVSVLDNSIKEYDIQLVRNSLNIVNNQMDFVSKYAGNVNGAGSRKFADSFLDDIRNAFSAMEYSVLLSEGMPKAYEVAMSFNEPTKIIVDMIVDMGETNSDKNVPKIKSNAKDLMSEISAFLKNLNNY